MDLMPFHETPAAAPRVPGFVARTLLGFGTHGEVWLADDLSTGGTVALKIGRRAPEEPAVASGAPPDRQPEQETALLCRIDHPHIVRLQRVVPLPAGGLAMVLDLASGGSLASLIAARGRFEPGEVSTLLVPLADALDHLHMRGVVHGDIAPGNVLFTGDGRPQLGDLGAARFLGSRIGDAWATPGFTDPALTRSGVDGVDLRAADLWGLAAVGWFALTGRPPEESVTGGAQATDRSPALGELLTQCLSAAPADRPSLHELADRAWQAARPTPVRLVSGRDPELEDPGLPPLANRVTRRVPMLSAAPSGADSLGADPLGAGSLGADLVGAGSRTGSPGAGTLARSPMVPRAGGRPGAVAAQPGEVASPPGSDRGGRFPGTVAGRRGPRLIAMLAVGTAVAAVSAAVTVQSGSSAEAGRGSPGLAPDVSISAASGPVASDQVASSQGSSGQDPPDGTGAVPEATDGLEAELTRALIAIGRSRAEAFSRPSASLLAGADVAGSPAYEEDVRLVQRLRSRGYRLQGVRYEFSKVQVLHRSGASVDVRAVVTTSEHRQVRIGSGVGIPVPADGPRAVVLTVAPIDLNVSGPNRWRVRSVQVPS